MARQVADEEDRLKRQARRRLIGAVALTTAIVVILPMVLDSEPQPAGQDIELRIPDQDKAGEFTPNTNLQPASAPVAPLSAVEPVPVAAPVSAVTPAPVVQAASAPAPAKSPEPAKAETKPEPAKPAQQPKAETRPSPAKPEARAEAKTEAKPAQPKAEARAEAKKDRAKKDEGGAKAGQHAAPHAGFVVQIGAFGNPDTAQSWAKNLVARGFKAYTEKSGDKTRVRIGPYSTREAANDARKKLEKSQGLRSNVVELN